MALTVHPLRHAHDFYSTPPEATRALLSAQAFDGSIWEPACGDGAIARVLALAGYSVVATDLIERGYGIGGINFLAESTPRARNIVTNPPYGSGLADRFIRHGLRLAGETGGSVAMLLDIASLAHPIRTPFYQACPPVAVYVLDELKFISAPIARPMRFCWVVWKSGHQGKTTISWLATARFRDRTVRKR